MKANKLKDSQLSQNFQAIIIPIFAIFLSLIAVALVLLLLGKNPIEAFLALLRGSGIIPKPAYAAHKGILTDFMSMLGILTPMIFAALAVAVAIKTGLFNIGVSGQMLLSGFIASVLVGYSSLSAPIARPLVILIGICVGASAGALIGFLKYKFNINEVVSSIILNYIFQFVISFFINSFFINPVSRQSEYISAASRLTLANVTVFGVRIDVPIGFFIAIPVAFAVHFLFNRTRIGYELKIVGLNRNAATYAGIKVGKNIVLAMLISGALAGLAGVTWYLGFFTTIQPKTLASTGFDAIAVCLLANSNPIGIIFSSLLITIISQGSTYMSSRLGVQQEIAQVITGLILLFSACGAYFKYLFARYRREQ